VLSSKPYNPSVALKEIEEITSLRDAWSPFWVLSTFESRLSISYSRKAGTNRQNDESSQYSLNGPGDRGRERVMSGEIRWKGGIQGPKRVNIVLPATTWFDMPGWEDKAIGFSNEWHLDDFPDTIPAFRDWWERLQSAHDIYIATWASYRGFVIRGKENDIQGYITLTEEDRPKLNAKRIRVFATRFGKPYDYGLTSKFAKEGDSIFLPIDMVTCVSIDQDALGKRYAGWKSGPFDKTFSDLGNATRNMAILRLDEVEKRLLEEASKGTEVFEMFGLKFQSDQITPWGILIVLSIQTYFLIYLKQLSGRLRSLDAGWDVPWIGMNQTIVAQFIFSLTLVLIPCVAVGLLAGRAMSPIIASLWGKTEHFRHLPQGLRPWDLGVLVNMLGLTGAIISTTLLGILSWKFRPKLVQEEATSCLPRLFE
jgi:hypothetical protein